MKSVKLQIINSIELRLRNRYYALYMEMYTEYRITMNKLDRMMISPRIGIHRNLK
jgi:hypothetical protein